MIFYMGNCLGNPDAEGFQEYIRTLLSENVEELYLRQLENNAKEWDHATSRMGFLTMMHDYHAKIAWKFSPIPDEPLCQQVSIMVRLTL
jgi:hypothetical protein